MQNSPDELILSSICPEIVIAGSLEVLKDPEIWICDMGASNHLTFLRVCCSLKRLSKIQRQSITRKAESKINILSIICDCFGNTCTRVTVNRVSYKGGSNVNLFVIDRCLIDRWKQNRDADYIMASKGGIEIPFPT